MPLVAGWALASFPTIAAFWRLGKFANARWTRAASTSYNPNMAEADELPESSAASQPIARDGGAGATAAETRPSVTLDDPSGPQTATSTVDLGRTEPGQAPTLPAEGAGRQELLEAVANGDLETIPRANYQALSEIARGGLGRIYRAIDHRLDRIVAIKELLRPTPTANARFLREVALTVRLEHPNIVSIYEAGRWPSGELFYAMNFVAGQTLLETLEEAKSLEQRLDLLPHLINVAKAIAFAHSEGIIHRDLKPANVLVGRFGETVVIDWGLAKYTEHTPNSSAQATALSMARHDEVPYSEAPIAGDTAHRSGRSARASKEGRADSSETRIGSIVGSPPYMPPEQARGEPADERSDVYAIGAMLYQVLGGHPPYHDLPQDRTLEFIQNRPPTPLRRLQRGLPRDLTTIARKAMSRSPADRYQDAGEMADDLGRFRAGLKVHAHRYTPIELLGRFVLRHSGAVLTSAVAVLVLMVAAAFSAVQISLERDRARADRDDAIVSEALALTDTDPTYALAELKRLREPVAGAISVAARAQEAGVSRWVLRGPNGALHCCALSPDGKWLVASGDDPKLYVWRMGEDAPAPQLLSSGPSHSDRVTSCQFSSDSSRLATGSREGKVLLWDTLDFGARALEAPGGAVKSLQFSADGSRLAAATDSPAPIDTLREWDLTRGGIKDQKLPNTRTPIVAYSPAGRLLSGPHQGQMRVWDQQLRTSIRSGSTGELQSALWVDEDRVLLGAENGVVSLWWPDSQTSLTLAELPGAVSSLDVAGDWASVGTATGAVFRVELPMFESLPQATPAETPALERPSQELTVQRLARHTERVNQVRISGSGRFVASGGWDRPVHVHDLQTGNIRTLLGHRDVITGLQFTPDERYLISASWDRTLRVWSLTDTLHGERQILRGHTVGVHGARFSPDGSRVITGGHDDTVRLWELDARSQKILSGHTDHVYRVLFSHDGKWAASSSDDRKVYLWSTDSGRGRPLVGHQADVEELSFSPDDKLLVSASEDHTARVWPLPEGDAQVLNHEHDVTRVEFSDGGRWLATASRSGNVRIFKVEGRRVVPQRVLVQHTAEVYGLDFGRGALLGSADISGAIWLHDLATEESKQVARIPGARLMRFSRDGTRFAIAAQGGRLFTCTLSADSCEPLRSGSAEIHAIAFSPDGETLYSAGSDAQLVAWYLPTGEHRVFLGHRSPIFDIDVSADGARILTASADQTARIWPAVPLPLPEHFQEFLVGLTAETAGGQSSRPSLR